VVIVATDSRRSWVRSICRNANAVTVPNPAAGIDVARAPERRNMILFLGKLQQSKGIFDLLQAVAEVRSSVPDVKLVCAGDGERIAVARQAERLGIADAVKFTGWVGPSGKRALLENAAVFALPSYDEALPVSLIEAMSAGVPVVATPVGGMPEVVADGKSGYLVAPGDKMNLQRALKRLLIDKALARSLGAAARETARARFAPERALPAIEGIYEALGVNGSAERPRELQLPIRKAA
jgi:glycosyltransferase involved in cell wall biosynthesis